jgi:hypothetical protein
MAEKRSETEPSISEEGQGERSVKKKVKLDEVSSKK